MNGSHIQPWWAMALRGVIALVFGVLVIMSPGITLLGLIALFAAYALFSGAISVIGAFQNRKRGDDWWLQFLLGLVSIGAGIIAIVHPGLTALVLVLLIGANALATGILDIATAIRLRKVIRNEWLLVLSGMVSVIFGILVFLFPGSGALALIWMISFYAMLIGVILLGLAFRLRREVAHEGYIGKERRVTPDRRIAGAH